MSKKLCGPLTQRELTKWPATAKRFVTPDLGGGTRVQQQ